MGNGKGTALITSILKPDQLQRIIPQITQSLSLFQGMKLVEHLDLDASQDAIIPIAAHLAHRPDELLAIAICRVTGELSPSPVRRKRGKEPSRFWGESCKPSDFKPAVNTNQTRLSTADLLHCTALTSVETDLSQSAQDAVRHRMDEELKRRKIDEIRHLTDELAAPAPVPEFDSPTALPNEALRSQSISEVIPGKSDRKNIASMKTFKCFPIQNLGFQPIAELEHLESTLPIQQHPDRLAKIRLHHPPEFLTEPQFLSSNISQHQPHSNHRCGPAHHQRPSREEKNPEQQSMGSELFIQSLDWESSRAREAFLHCVEMTYLHSNDCTSLLSLHSAEQTLNEYRDSSAFDPNAWLAMKDESTGDLAGCLILAAEPTDGDTNLPLDESAPTSGAIEVVYLGVTQRYRGQGIGDSLLSLAEPYARFWGRERILLTVDRNNLSAMRLYKRNGFKSLERENLWIKRVNR